MKLDIDYIKEVAKLLGFLPQEGSKDTYYKVYLDHNNYIIKVDFDNHVIDYGEKIKKGDLTTSNFENSENFVVLECVNRLLEKGYPPERISLEHKWPMGRKEKGKLDILITDKEDKAYLMIECKTWGQEYNKEKRKMQKDGGQLFSYYQQDKATQYLCLYTSRIVNDNIEYINDIVKVDERWKGLNNQKEVFDHWNKNFKDNGIFDEWTSPYNIEIKALTRGRLQELTENDSGKIFNQFAEILRHNIVSDKPNAFNKMLNLFICKIIDEDKNDYEEVDFQWFEDDTNESLQMRLNDLYKEGMKRFLDIEVTDYSNDELEDKLYNINEPEIKEQIQEMFKEMRLQKNPEFAFKEVYNDESFKENAIVVKEVVELLQPYQFRYGHKQQFLGDFFELLLNTSIKQESGQYFTPIPIAKFIVSCLPIKEIILKNIEENAADILPYAIDYATGSGHFLTEWMDLVQGMIDGLETGGMRPSARRVIKAWQENPFQWAKDYVYGVEADYRLVKTAKVSSFLNGDGEATIIRANGLDNFKYSTDFKGRLKEFNQEDNKLNEQFDIVIANPPYSVNAFKNTIKYGEESFDLYNRLTDKSSEIECLFVERTSQLLKDGGLAGIILPNSILTNEGIYIYTRELLLKYFDIKGIVDLGANTFMVTGTKTIILFLERKSNNVHKKISQGIKNFFERPKDMTLNGIEEAFSKYVKDVCHGITISDYITFVNKEPNEQVKGQEIYKEYLKWFNNLTEIKQLKNKKTFKNKPKDKQQEELDRLFYEKVFALEQEKMLYFFLTYNQKTVLIRTGEKQEEKDFLGYEFSTRRGHEGIKVYRDSDGELTTKLYNEDNILTPEKANYYIYKSFLGEEVAVVDELKGNVSINKLVDMINFNQVDFQKSINLTYKKKVRLDYKWNLVKLNALLSTIEMGSRPKGGVQHFNDGVLSLGGEHIGMDGKLYLKNIKYVPEEYFNSSRKGKVKGEDILICKDGALTGKIAMVPKTPAFRNAMINEHVFRLRANDKIYQKYLFEFLYSETGQEILKSNITGQAQGGLTSKNLKNIEIPLPPKSIQKKIVEECSAIDKKYEILKAQVDNFKNDIDSIIEKIYTNRFEFKKLSELVIINPSKKEIRDIDDDTIVSFVEMASVNENGYIENKEDRLLGELRKGSYTYFKENDIIIAKITPSMENGKCALASGLMNGLGMGSSEFHVFRAFDDIVLNEYIFLLLNREKVRTEAKENMTGASGHRRVPADFYKNYMIPVPSKGIQQQVVSEIKTLKNNIIQIEHQLQNNNEKEQILRNYLE